MFHDKDSWTDSLHLDPHLMIISLYFAYMIRIQLLDVLLQSKKTMTKEFQWKQSSRLFA